MLLSRFISPGKKIDYKGSKMSRGALENIYIYPSAPGRVSYVANRNKVFQESFQFYARLTSLCGVGICIQIERGDEILFFILI